MNNSLLDLKEMVKLELNSILGSDYFINDNIEDYKEDCLIVLSKKNTRIYTMVDFVLLVTPNYIQVVKEIRGIDITKGLKNFEYANPNCFEDLVDYIKSQKNHTIKEIKIVMFVVFVVFMAILLFYLSVIR